MKYFEASVKLVKENEEGLLKLVSEKFLVDALNHTEAEVAVTKFCEEYSRGHFELKRLTPVEFSDLLFEDDFDKLYKVKYSFPTVTESGREKDAVHYLITDGGDIDEALTDAEVFLGSMAVSCTIRSISEYPVTNFIPTESLEAQERVELNSDDYDEDRGLF